MRSVYRFRGHLIWAPKFKKGRKRKTIFLHKNKKVSSVTLFNKLMLNQNTLTQCKIWSFCDIIQNFTFCATYWHISLLKMLRRFHKTDCNIILPILLINLAGKECNLTKAIHFQIWFNTVRRTDDLRKAFLEHLEVQILPFGTSHGGASGWPSTSHNSTDAQIRTLHQPLYVDPYVLPRHTLFHLTSWLH